MYSISFLTSLFSPTVLAGLLPKKQNLQCCILLLGVLNLPHKLHLYLGKVIMVFMLIMVVIVSLVNMVITDGRMDSWVDGSKILFMDRLLFCDDAPRFDDGLTGDSISL